MYGATGMTQGSAGPQELFTISPDGTASNFGTFAHSPWRESEPRGCNVFRPTRRNTRPSTGTDHERLSPSNRGGGPSH